MNRIHVAIASVLILFALTLGLVSQAFARGGSDVPFPLDYPLPFPWDSINGVWEVKSCTFKATFTFEVENDCDGRQILRVRQVEADTDQVIADGIGYKLDSGEQVIAAMSGKGTSYMLYVGAYEDTQVTPATKEYVLRVVSFDGQSQEDRYQIKKISDKVSNDPPPFPWNCSYRSKVGK